MNLFPQKSGTPVQFITEKPIDNSGLIPFLKLKNNVFKTGKRSVFSIHKESQFVGSGFLIYVEISGNETFGFITCKHVLPEEEVKSKIKSIIFRFQGLKINKEIRLKEQDIEKRINLQTNDDDVTFIKIKTDSDFSNSGLLLKKLKYL